MDTIGIEQFERRGLKLNAAQLQVLGVINSQILSNAPVRVFVLKGRCSGITTFFAAVTHIFGGKWDIVAKNHRDVDRLKKSVCDGVCAVNNNVIIEEIAHCYEKSDAFCAALHYAGNDGNILISTTGKNDPEFNVLWRDVMDGIGGFAPVFIEGNMADRKKHMEQYGYEAAQINYPLTWEEAVGV